MLDTKVKETETMLNTKNRQEVLEVLDFMNELDSDSRKEFINFIQGARFVMGLNKTA